MEVQKKSILRKSIATTDTTETLNNNSLKFDNLQTHTYDSSKLKSLFNKSSSQLSSGNTTTNEKFQFQFFNNSEQVPTSSLLLKKNRRRRRRT